MRSPHVVALCLTLVSLVVGCGRQANTVASFAYEFVKWDDHIYRLTPESVSRVDQQIGKVTNYSDLESASETGTFSNKYPVGTKLYSIANMDETVAIAVQTKEGTYLKAVNPDTEFPDAADVTSMTVRASGLPGSKQATFTNANGQSTVEQVVTWLRHADEVGLEQPTPGKGGYPPSLLILMQDGNKIVVGPAVDWSVKKLSSGSTEISGKNVVNYVAVSFTNQPNRIRLYSPELYKWIVNHEWES